MNAIPLLAVLNCFDIELNDSMFGLQLYPMRSNSLCRRFCNDRVCWLIVSFCVSSFSFPGMARAQNSLIPDQQLTFATGEIVEAECSRSGNLLAVSWKPLRKGNSKFQVIHLGNGRPLTGVVELDTGQAVGSMGFSADSKYLVLCANYGVQIREVKTGAKRFASPARQGIWQVECHPTQSEFLASGGSEKTLRRIEIPSGRILADVETNFHVIPRVEFAPDGKSFLMIGETRDKKRFLQFRSYPEMEVLAEPVSNWPWWRINNLQISPDGRRYVAGDRSGRFFVGDMQTTKIIRTLEVKHKPVDDFRFIDDARLVTIGAKVKSAIIDIDETDKSGVLTDVPVAGLGIAVSRSTNRVYMGAAKDSKVRSVLAWDYERFIPIQQMAVVTEESVQAKGSPVSSDRQPVPSAQQLKAARETLSSLVGSDSSSELAERLTRLSDEEQDPANRYVMLETAAQMLIDGGDARSAQNTIEKVEFAFDTRPLTIAGRLLRKASGKKMPLSKQSGLGDWAERLGDQAIERNEVQFAEAFFRIATQWSGRDPAKLKRRKSKAKNSTTLADDFLRNQELRAAVEASPNDPQANERLGRYLCFEKADWKAGLSYLAKGKSQDLRQLVLDDIAGTAVARDQLAMAARWKAYAESQTDKVAMDGALAAAKYWFLRAAKNSTGLTKLTAESEAMKIDLQSRE